MTFEEYKKAVSTKFENNECAKRYPEEYKRAFDAEIESCFAKGDSVESAAWFIDLMIGTD